MANCLRHRAIYLTSRSTMLSKSQPNPQVAAAMQNIIKPSQHCRFCAQYEQFAQSGSAVKACLIDSQGWHWPAGDLPWLVSYVVERANGEIELPFKPFKPLSSIKPSPQRVKPATVVLYQGPRSKERHEKRVSRKPPKPMTYRVLCP